MTYIELGDICDISKGEIGITKAIPGEYPMVTTGAERKSHNAFQLDTEAVLVPLVSATGHGHASIKRIHFQEGKFAFGSILAACVPKNNKYSAKFLYIYFQLMKDYILVPLMKGSANVSLTLGNLKTAKVPDISREMQESIVKLYSTLKIEQDETISILSNQKSDIDSLRQAILQEAVQGKLTVKWREANPSVEHASELLKRIEAEKQQLIAKKKIRREKAFPRIEDDEKEFNLPNGWIWCRFQQIFDIRDGTHDSPKDSSDTNSYPLITSKNFKEGNIDFDTARRISEADYLKVIYRSKVHTGDILFSMIGGNIGNQVEVGDYTEFAIKNVALFKHYNSDTIAKGFLSVFSKFIAMSLQSHAAGGAQPFVSLKFFRNLVLGLPPKEEQQAIVGKVNSLMALCDELEQEVDNSQTQVEQLMQSCLKEVFEEESN
jgi:type I restriction enzyme, S subunit